MSPEDRPAIGETVGIRLSQTFATWTGDHWREWLPGDLDQASRYVDSASDLPGDVVWEDTP